MNANILRGWKQIEGYLGITRKTIIKRGYPVRKASGSRSQVYALASELDGYLEHDGEFDDLDADDLMDILSIFAPEGESAPLSTEN